MASGGRIDRDRRAEEVVEGEQEYLLRDRRVLDVLGFKQDWSSEPSDRHYLRWGFDLRRLESDYDYLSVFPAEDLLDDSRTGTTSFRRRFDGEQVGLYLSDRLRLWGALTAELGLRYDEHTLTGDRDLSPRLNLVAALGEASTLRAAWGHFFQGQRLYELQVEDGETGFFPGELTEHYVVGFEHRFRHGETLRLDTGCLVAFDGTVSYDIQMVKGVTNVLFGGEGLFLATLRGRGDATVRSAPRVLTANRGKATVAVGEPVATPRFALP